MRQEIKMKMRDVVNCVRDCDGMDNGIPPFGENAPGRVTAFRRLKKMRLESNKFLFFARFYKWRELFRPVADKTILGGDFIPHVCVTFCA